jgi:hypothetical protein
LDIELLNNIVDPKWLNRIRIRTFKISGPVQVMFEILKKVGYIYTTRFEHVELSCKLTTSEAI